MEARFNGKCICGKHVTKGDEVRFANKKIVKCAGCHDFGALKLSDGNGLGWIWGYRLGQNVDVLRAIYRNIRAAYLALAPQVDGWGDRQEQWHGEVLGSIRGISGREHATTEEFDAVVKASIAKELKDWGGEESYDRLSIGQLFCLHAAWMYHRAAASKTWIEASPETKEWGGFLGGEMIHTHMDAEKSLDEMVANARNGLRAAA